METPVLVFDLGMVLYKVDYSASLKNFEALHPEKSIRISEFFDLPVFRQLETGELGEEEFHSYLQRQLGLNGDENQIEFAWNSMLSGILPGRIRDLEILRKNHRIFLLSNTNRIHFRRLRTECADLFSLFEQCFFSFDLGLRKPDPEIFLRVAEKGNFSPSASVMVDDLLPNIQGAEKAGMRGFHFQVENDWEKFMLEFGMAETKTSGQRL